MRVGRAGLFAAALVCATLASSRASRATDEVTPLASVPVIHRVALGRAEPAAPPVLSEVEYASRWRGAGFSGVYLPPKDAYVADDGGVDLAFHFNAALVAESDWRRSATNAVVVSVSYGIGSGTYSEPFSSPGLFGHMVRSVIGELQKEQPKGSGKKLYARRITLAAWSAGFGAVGKILAIPDYYEKVDSVVLLDGIHAPYIGPGPHQAAEGAERVDLKMIDNLVKFARDAAAGKKTMVITHTSIVPPDYASASETTTALLGAVGLARTAVTREADERGMTLTSLVDQKGLHVRGFGGNSKGAHMKHLHLVGWAMREFVAPERARALTALRAGGPAAVAGDAAPAR